MNKKSLIISIIAVLACFSAFLIFRIRSKQQHKETLKANIQTLPNLTVYDLDSTKTNLYQAINSHEVTLLIFFSPSCEHCQYEASEISKHFVDFDHKNLVFISWESIKDIQNFKKQYFKADRAENAHFYKADLAVLSSNFGKLSVPSIYIYQPDKKLSKQYIGETKIQLLITND